MLDQITDRKEEVIEAAEVLIKYQGYILSLIHSWYIKKNVFYGFKYALKWILMKCKITLGISLF